MENPIITVKEIEEFLANRYERFASKKAVVYPYIERTVFMDITRDEVLRQKLLDVEPLYRKAGWQVEYDKHAYCENYEPFFIFSKK